jgi:putative ABC transport system substrate-binding protein
MNTAQAGLYVDQLTVTWRNGHTALRDASFSVPRGAIAALGINYRDLGEQTGRMVVRILKGEKPGDIKPETSSKLELFVNPGAAEKQGAKLSEQLVKSAAQVVQ